MKTLCRMLDDLLLRHPNHFFKSCRRESMFSAFSMAETILSWKGSWLWGRGLLLLISGFGCCGFRVSGVRFCQLLERILESPLRGHGR